MARRKIEHFVETCDFCGKTFQNTSEEPSMLHPVYFYHYGGYGDQERIVSSKDACNLCYKNALEDGYGESHKEATYFGNIRR